MRKTFKAWMFAGLGLLMISVVIFCLSAIRVTRQNVAQTPAVPKATLLDERYVLGADSLPQSGVPAGTVSDFSLEKSGTYPGYSHRWWLYVPAGYDGKTPLALMVFQDGRDFVARDGTWRVPVALDNLIFRNELPLMVALFMTPDTRSDLPNWRASSDPTSTIC